jgi:hypothetical protein
VAVVAGGDGLGLEGAVSVERVVGQAALSVTVARDDALPEEATRPAYWRARGYSGLDAEAVVYTPAASPNHASEWSIRVDGRAVPSEGLALGASVAMRDYRGLAIEAGDFRPDSAGSVAGTVVVLPAQSGRVVSLLATASGTRGIASWSASYRFERTVAGSDTFREAWMGVPQHLARGRLTVRPEARLALRLAMEARSGASWPAFLQFAGCHNALGHVYRSSVPAAIVVDADAERALLDGRLVLTLSLRNLLNVEERTHPLGASLAFRMVVQASLRL